MGNFNAESALRPNNLQDTYNRSFGMTDEEYTNAVNNGTYGDNKFIHDQGGYGLAQWTYWSLKSDLINHARKTNRSIDNPDVQIETLYNQLRSMNLFDKLNNANSVRDASTIMLKKFENPADQSEAVVNKRAQYSQSYYDMFANGVGGPVNEPTVSIASQYNRFGATGIKNSTVPDVTKILQNVKPSSDNSNIIEYLKKIADGIMSIVNNTDDTNSKLEDIKKIESEKKETSNNVAVIDNSKKQSNSPMFDIASNRRTNLSGS